MINYSTIGRKESEKKHKEYELSLQNVSNCGLSLSSGFGEWWYVYTIDRQEPIYNSKSKQKCKEFIKTEITRIKQLK